MDETTVIVDIDGTVSKVGDRIKYLQQDPKDWDAFYEACDEDEPHAKIVRLVQILIDSGYEIVFLTGRREGVREKTERWLEKHNLFGTLLMRPDGDFRHDTEVKPMLLKMSVNTDTISFILEDRNSMVQKWREMGFVCLQVADGDF